MSTIDTVYKTFNDRNGRTIVVGVDDTDIVAEHNGIEVGRFGINSDEIEEGHPDVHTLYHIEIKPTIYKRCGIATEMFKAAEYYYNNFDIADKFTDEGAAFLNSLKHSGQWSYGHNNRFDNRYC